VQAVRGARAGGEAAEALAEHYRLPADYIRQKLAEPLPQPEVSKSRRKPPTEDGSEG